MVKSIKINVYRGSEIESQHLVDAIVVNEKGQAVEQFGNLFHSIFPRSSIKMVQALAILDSQADQKFNLNSKQLSIACASHHGEKIHTDVIFDWLKKIKLDESYLECGAHRPYSDYAYEELIKKNIQFSSVHNNCSGKHCGMYKISDKVILGSKGEFKAVKAMNFTITADHRLIDGAVAANFLKAFLGKIQSPGKLMIDMI